MSLPCIDPVKVLRASLDIYCRVQGRGMLFLGLGVRRERAKRLTNKRSFIRLGDARRSFGFVIMLSPSDMRISMPLCTGLEILRIPGCTQM